jgi:hypothetical protein
MRSPVADALAALAGVLEALGIRWYLFGAQAALVHGAARLTADIDATVALGAYDAAALVRALAAAGFAPRIPDVDAFAERTGVIPMLHQGSEIAVDLIIAGPGLEELFLQRARPQLIAAV